MSVTQRRKSDRLSWFKMDAGAFLADTTGLPAANVGILIRLMSLYWTSGAQLPDNPATLKRKISVVSDEDERALQEVLAEFFPEMEHAGLDLQLSETIANSRMQSEKAKSRHAKTDSVQTSTAAQSSPNDF